MKKLKTFVTMAIVAMMTLVTFSSCDRDKDIAYTLDGLWRGNMYVQHSYSGRVYKATYSEIEFIANGAFSSSGTGHWVDYYSNAPWDYIYNDISWTVRDGNIYVRFRQEGTEVVIYHYTLNNRYFDGVLEDNGQTVSFSLDRISSPSYGTWGDYSYWEFNQAKGKNSRTDSVEMPRRGISIPQE